MHIFNRVCLYISNATSIEVKYISLIISTLLVILIGFIIKKICKKIFRLLKDEKKEYNFNQRVKLVINILLVIMLLFIWGDYVRSALTLVSFLSAAFAIALRDIILNWFCGVYIKIAKIFKIEDRIEIDGIKGDVMMISTLEFEILEISGRESNGQSTGIVITFPNSVVFSKPVKNYTKGFKYIWNEMIIKVPLNCDLTGIKKEIYKIVNNIDIIKNIPKKMENQISSLNTNYRIYFNKYDPIIYTKIVDNYIELTLRYLIHPKKARYVESVIWNNILALYRNETIVLYDKEN